MCNLTFYEHFKYCIMNEVSKFRLYCIQLYTTFYVDIKDERMVFHTKFVYNKKCNNKLYEINTLQNINLL